MPDIILKTENLTKKYGSSVAVNNLNLQVGKGEIFGLLGPNGAGKTTTILMLLGLTEPTSGRAVINGRDCTRDPIGIKRIVGYLPDNVAFYSDMTGRENLQFVGELNGLSAKEADARIEMLLERTGMTQAADKKVRTYSRGMCQRLGIADVLMKDPAVILMDEPTLGIDPEGMHELLSIISDLAHKDGRTVLISSHQLYQVQQICDRVGIFVDGSLVACGDIATLRSQLSADTLYFELEASPADDKLTELINDIDGVSDVRRERDLFVVSAKSDIRGRLAERMVKGGYSLLHLRQRGNDLDDIYRRYFSREEVVS